MRSIPDSLVATLHRRCHAARWAVSRSQFAAALSASAVRAFDGREPAAPEIERYLNALHLEDLVLALACANGHEPAGDAFIEKFRPVLYRTAAALDAIGDARELADARARTASVASFRSITPTGRTNERMR